MDGEASTSKHAFNHRLKRRHQPAATEALGTAWTSPKRSRSTKGKMQCDMFDIDIATSALRKRIELLEAKSHQDNSANAEVPEAVGRDEFEEDYSQPLPPSTPPHSEYEELPPASPSPEPFPPDDSAPSPGPALPTDTPRKKRRILPSAKKSNLYSRWLDLVPRLVAPYVAYLEQAYAREVLPRVPPALSTCLEGSECRLKHRTTDVLCLFTHRKYETLFQ